MNADENRWYIDTWDAQAGRAFVSRRTPDLFAQQGSGEAPVAFIAPPHFRPVHLVSRSIGYAASRGQFQVGFRLNETEVGFATLDEVVTLVRRVFGAWGRNPPGGDGPRGPGEPPGEPPAPDFGGGHRAPDQRLASAFDAFEYTTQGLDAMPQGSSICFDWRQALQADEPLDGASLLFRWLARIVLREWVDRVEYDPSPSTWKTLWRYVHFFTYVTDGIDAHPIDAVLPHLNAGRMSWARSNQIDRPYQLFAKVPLPGAVGSSGTLLDFLCRAFAGVRKSNGRYIGQHAIERVLLLAMATVVQSWRANRGIPDPWQVSFFDDQADARASRACRWLAGQLPSRIYSGRVEQAIAEIAQQD